jgi:threonine/homoserine/homoserine lactone efflux protein
MTPSSFVALFGTMLILALTPGIGVFTVTARTLAGGIAHGLAATVGLILGDIIFILLVVYGLGYVAETAAPVLLIINAGSGLYLLWMGVSLWRANPPAEATAASPSHLASLRSSMATGLLITMGNPKAILFYIGFLPAFVDLTTFTVIDTGFTILSATLAIGTAMTGYIFLAHKFATRPGSTQFPRLLSRLAAATLVLTALAILSRLSPLAFP